MPTSNENLFESTLNIIKRLRGVSAPKVITDSDLKGTDLGAIQERTVTYTHYLKSYVSEYQRKSRHQRNMKIWFFAIVMSLLCIIILASFISLIIISCKNDIKSEDIATLITAIVGAFSAFIFLPKVIASNLFPSKEEDKTAEIFSNMFEYDISLRGLYHVNENPAKEEPENIETHELDNI